MAIIKEFIPHTELKASDLNELVTQVNAYIAEINAALEAAIASSSSGIERQAAQSEEQAIIFETDGGVQVGKIDSTGVDFIDLKRGGQQVARMSDLPTVPTLDTNIGSSPSNSHTPSSKAVKDYVDANAIGDLPISKSEAQGDTEEVRLETDSGTLIGKVTSECADFVNLKKNGKEVALEEDLPDIERSQTTDMSEKVVVEDDNGNLIAEMSPNGIKAASFRDLEGNLISGGSSVNTFGGVDGAGFLSKENIDACDYCYIPFYGQSYTVANDGEYKLTTSFDRNCFMCGDSVKSTNGSQINPLSTDADTEMTVPDACDLISRLWKKYAHKSQDFIVGSYGVGNRTISQLSKGGTLYTNFFLAGLTSVKNTLQGMSKTFNCPAIIYLQGETDTLNVETSCYNDKALYKQRFLQLKADMQADLMAATGQSTPPIVIIYNVGGRAFKSKFADIAQAANELAQECEDVISIGSYYQYPDYTYHLTPDGRRWLAEHIAKVYCEVLMLGRRNWFFVQSAVKNGNTIMLTFQNAVYPIVFDIYTVEGKTYKGFRVYDSYGNEVTITNVKTDGCCITIEVSSMPQGTISLVYGGSADNGEGNVRDSEHWKSFHVYESNSQGTSQYPLTYTPLWVDGRTYIGHSYGMQKWLPIFSIEL